MNKLEIALYLINEAVELEKVYLEYRKDYKDYDLKELWEKYPHTPTKQPIIDNLKMARRLLSEEMKEL